MSVAIAIPLELRQDMDAALRYSVQGLRAAFYDGFNAEWNISKWAENVATK